MEEKLDKLLGFMSAFHSEITDFRREMRDSIRKLEQAVSGFKEDVANCLEKLEKNVTYLKQNTVLIERFRPTEKQLASVRLELSSEIRHLETKTDKLSFDVYEEKAVGLNNEAEINDLKERVSRLEEKLQLLEKTQ